MNTPPIVSQQEWEAARQQLLVKEKALTRSRDALAAERRRMPWMAVEKKYEFDGPKGKVSLLDLFEGRRQLIVYRAFFEPGVFGWPEHACRGCSLGADQVAHLAHLNARDTTLAYASRAPQTDIERLKARMGWEMPWYTITDSFDTDFGVDEWHGHNVFFRDGDQVFRTYFINNRGDEAMGTTWSYLDITPLGRQETWEDSPEGYPQTPPYKWWNWHDNYDAEASPDPKWVEMSDAGEAAFRKRDAEPISKARERTMQDILRSSSQEAFFASRLCFPPQRGGHDRAGHCPWADAEARSWTMSMAYIPTCGLTLLGTVDRRIVGAGGDTQRLAHWWSDTPLGDRSRTGPFTGSRLARRNQAAAPGGNALRGARAQAQLAIHRGANATFGRQCQPQRQRDGRGRQNAQPKIARNGAPPSRRAMGPQ